jgi:diguanylate cyclase (GGDEF)-like protein
MKILLIDDTKVERTIVATYLKKMGHEVITGNNGREALELYQKEDADLVLMDVAMPVMDGYEAARRMRTVKEDWIPIIFLSGNADPEDIVAGIAAGGDDYLTKPVDKTILSAKMAAMERIADMRTQLLELSQELARANSELQKLADADGLTGLANRRTLDNYLEREVARAIREAHPISVIMIDLDHFKAYNDHYGHLAGDNCLKQIAAVLRREIKRPGDLVGRYGGEEFCAVLPDTGHEGVRHIAEHIRHEVKKLAIPHSGNGKRKVVTLSLGVVTHIPDPSFPVTRLLSDADKALYHAKQSGRNRVEVYS